MEGLTFLGKLFVILFVIALCFLCFYGATFADGYFVLGFSFFPIIIGLFISIFYLVESIIKKKIYPMVFFIVFLIFSSFLGRSYIDYRVDRLNDIGKIVEEYYEKNETEILDDTSIKRVLNIYENISIKYYTNGFDVYYDNEDRFYYSSDEKRVWFRILP